MDIGERIKKRRRQLGMNAEALAAVIGVSPATVYRYESKGIANMGADKLHALAEALQVTPDYLLGWEGAPLPPELRSLDSLPAASLPMIGEVAAGKPLLAEQDFETRVDTGREIRADYALTVRGDSMAPTYLDGDVLFIRRQDDVRDGQVAVVLVDDSATLKHVYHHANALTLVSDNPAYAPMRVSTRHQGGVRILGVVVGFQRLYATDPMRNVRKGFPKG